MTLLVCLLYFSAVNIKRSDDTATRHVHSHLQGHCTR